MQFTKTFFLVLFCSLFVNFSAKAQTDYSPLFQTINAPIKKDFPTNQLDAKRVNFLKLDDFNGKKLSNLPDKMQFNLFSDVAIEVELSKSSKSYYKNMLVYRGKSGDKRFAHLPHYRDVIIIYNPNTGNITVQLATTQGTFEIRPTTKDSEYQVIQWKDEEIDCQNFHDKTTPLHHNTATTKNVGCNEQDADGKFVADLFVGYSYESAARVTDIDAHALSLVEMVNNGLTNSLVDNIYIRLVGTGISEHNPGVVTSVLGDVWDWFAAEIAQTGADYVASIQVPTGGPNEAGGWAGVGGYSSVNSINSTAAVFAMK